MATGMEDGDMITAIMMIITGIAQPILNNRITTKRL
jgi:hypothetical protein